MNVTQMGFEKEEAATLDTPHVASKVFAPDTTQRPYPRARCCARCQRGTREHNMPCGFQYMCPNPGCDHGRRS